MFPVFLLPKRIGESRVHQVESAPGVEVDAWVGPQSRTAMAFQACAETAHPGHFGKPVIRKLSRLSPPPISSSTLLATRSVTVFAIKRPESESKPAVHGKSGGSVAHNRPPSTRFLALIRFDQIRDSDLRGPLRIPGTGLLI